MIDFEHDGTEVDVCPGCKGVWLDADELSRLARMPLPPRFERRPDLDAAETAVIDLTTSSPCPHCNLALASARLPVGGIYVDACPSCRGLFLERGRLAAIRAAANQQNAERRALEQQRIHNIEVERRSKRRAWEETHDRHKGFEVRWAWYSRRTLVSLLFGIPVEEANRLRSKARVVWGLIAFNVLVFALHVSGLVPAEGWAATPGEIAQLSSLHTIFTAMFTHGGILHLLGNMYFLWVFGDNVEDRIGPWAFIGWYLVWGLAATCAKLLFDPASHLITPHVGASGAIAGAMGAYLILYPRRRVIVPLFGILVFGWVLFAPAWGFLAYWVGVNALGAGLGVSSVCWVGHLGGFAAGVAVGLGYKFLSAPKQPGTG